MASVSTANVGKNTTGTTFRAVASRRAIQFSLLKGKTDERSNEIARTIKNLYIIRMIQELSVFTS